MSKVTQPLSEEILGKINEVIAHYADRAYICSVTTVYPHGFNTRPDVIAAVNFKNSAGFKTAQKRGKR
jgi:hypothetical protein